MKSVSISIENVEGFPSLSANSAHPTKIKIELELAIHNERRATLLLLYACILSEINHT